MKLIVLELNEVPIKILDWYSAQDQEFSRLISRSFQFSTLVRSDPILSPWTTWPTFHTGNTQSVHGIQDLGEPLASYSPLWQSILERGYSSAVFGSLHSSSTRNLQRYSFFIPDFFSSVTDTNPSSLEPFFTAQLAATKQSSRNVSRSLSSFNLSALLSFFSYANICRVVSPVFYQLISEFFDPSRLSRRRDLQTTLNFELFYQLFKGTQPEFSTFFINSVAASMHRFWAASFPEDFPQLNYNQSWLNSYKKDIYFSMKTFSNVLKQLYRLTKHTDTNILVLSSMGQAAYSSQPQSYTWTIPSIIDFIRKSGFPDASQLTESQSMYPIYSVVSTRHVISQLFDHLSVFKPSEDLKFRIRQHQSSHSLSIEINSHSPAPFLEYNGQILSLQSLGFSYSPLTDMSTTTAYHIPEGIGFFIGKQSHRFSQSLQYFEPHKVYLDTLYSSLLSFYPTK